MGVLGRYDASSDQLQPANGCAFSLQRFQSSTTAVLSQSDEALREQLLSKLIEDKLLGPSRQVVELKPEELPVRELPPGTTASLFLMYLAYMRPSGITPACRSSFYEDFAVHAQKCSELLAHYTAQWRDREVYWAARDRSDALSREGVGQNPFQECSFCFRVSRQQCSLVKKPGDVIFCLSFTCTLRLWLQCDNTVKEVRNQYGSRMMASLCQSGIFSSCSEAHLRVGHTHEDVDALFSLCTAAIRSSSSVALQTPHDLQKVIDKKLGPIFFKKGQAWGIELVRDWTAIMPDAVTFKNAFRARKMKFGPGDGDDPQKPLPQMFTFMPRAGLPDQGRDLDLQERVPRAMRAADHGNSQDDIFCLVKESMAARTLSQDPLLVFPASLLPASQKFFLDANSERCPLRSWKLEADRWDELRAIRAAIQTDFPHMTKAVRWYEQLLHNPQARAHFRQVPQLTFLRHACAGQQDWRSFQLGSRPPAPKPHELQVVFHRAR
eukprot:s2181_g11.t1